MPIGTEKWFNAQKGYGFIHPEDGDKDVFVDISAIERAGLGSLNEGQKLKYELQRDQHSGNRSGGLSCLATRRAVVTAHRNLLDGFARCAAIGGRMKLVSE